VGDVVYADDGTATAVAYLEPTALPGFDDRLLGFDGERWRRVAGDCRRAPVLVASAGAAWVLYVDGETVSWHAVEP
jgi:hypothetical protein